MLQIDDFSKSYFWKSERVHGKMDAQGLSDGPIRRIPGIKTLNWWNRILRAQRAVIVSRSLSVILRQGVGRLFTDVLGGIGDVEVSKALRKRQKAAFGRAHVEELVDTGKISKKEKAKQASVLRMAQRSGLKFSENEVYEDGKDRFLGYSSDSAIPVQSSMTRGRSMSRLISRRMMGDVEIIRDRRSSVTQDVVGKRSRGRLLSRVANTMHLAVDVSHQQDEESDVESEYGDIEPEWSNFLFPSTTPHDLATERETGLRSTVARVETPYSSLYAPADDEEEESIFSGYGSDMEFEDIVNFEDTTLETSIREIIGSRKVITSDSTAYRSIMSDGRRSETAKAQLLKAIEKSTKAYVRLRNLWNRSVDNVVYEYKQENEEDDAEEKPKVKTWKAKKKRDWKQIVASKKLQPHRQTQSTLGRKRTKHAPAKKQLNYYGRTLDSASSQKLRREAQHPCGVWEMALSPQSQILDQLSKIRSDHSRRILFNEMGAPLGPKRNSTADLSHISLDMTPAAVRSPTPHSPLTSNMPRKLWKDSGSDHIGTGKPVKREMKLGTKVVENISEEVGEFTPFEERKDLAQQVTKKKIDPLTIRRELTRDGELQIDDRELKEWEKRISLSTNKRHRVDRIKNFQRLLSGHFSDDGSPRSPFPLSALAKARSVASELKQKVQRKKQQSFSIETQPASRNRAPSGMAVPHTASDGALLSLPSLGAPRSAGLSILCEDSVAEEENSSTTNTTTKTSTQGPVKPKLDRKGSSTLFAKLGQSGGLTQQRSSTSITSDASSLGQSRLIEVWDPESFRKRNEERFLKMFRHGLPNRRTFGRNTVSEGALDELEDSSSDEDVRNPPMLYSKGEEQLGRQTSGKGRDEPEHPRSQRKITPTVSGTMFSDGLKEKDERERQELERLKQASIGNFMKTYKDSPAASRQERAIRRSDVAKNRPWTSSPVCLATIDSYRGRSIPPSRQGRVTNPVDEDMRSITLDHWERERFVRSTTPASHFEYLTKLDST